MQLPEQRVRRGTGSGTRYATVAVNVTSFMASYSGQDRVTVLGTADHKGRTMLVQTETSMGQTVDARARLTWETVRPLEMSRDDINAVRVQYGLAALD